MFCSKAPEKSADGTYFVKTIHLQDIFKQLGLHLSEKESSKIRAEFESSFKDGKVPMKNLEEYLAEYLLKYDSKEIHEALRRLDMDKDGKISEEEFRYYLENYGEKLKPEVMKDILELA